MCFGKNFWVAEWGMGRHVYFYVCGKLSTLPFSVPVLSLLCTRCNVVTDIYLNTDKTCMKSITNSDLSALALQLLITLQVSWPSVQRNPTKQNKSQPGS